MIAARRFNVIYEGGRRGVVEAEDSVAALALAQRLGVVVGPPAVGLRAPSEQPAPGSRPERDHEQLLTGYPTREDAMSKTHADTECYCEQCCDSATEWWEWRSEDGEMASGSRYWTKEHALADKGAALADGLPVLVRQA